MKKNPCLFPLLFFALLPGIACNTSYQSQSLAYQSYRVSNNLQKDAEAQQLIQPYSDEVNKTMNNIIGYADHSLEKIELGKFMVDAFLEMAIEKYQVKVDAAFMNPGGIRLNQLPAGNITNGKIYELMPFDNILILQKMKGTELQEFLDHTAARGGWPVNGIRMEIKDLKAINVWVGDHKLDMNGSYTIANSDFVANGGDDAAMLSTIPQITNGYLVRDAIFDHVKKLKSQGFNIKGKN